MPVNILVIHFFILQSTHSSHTWLPENLLSPPPPSPPRPPWWRTFGDNRWNCFLYIINIIACENCGSLVGDLWSRWDYHRSGRDLDLILDPLCAIELDLGLRKISIDPGANWNAHASSALMYGGSVRKSTVYVAAVTVTPKIFNYQGNRLKPFRSNVSWLTLYALGNSGG